MGNGGRRRLTVAAPEVAPGWRSDEPPDLTPGEHDMLAAMLEQARSDVRINLDNVPPSRREEAIAAKLTAYEWIRSDDDYLMSFRSVCLHLGIVDVERARAVLLDGVVMPTNTTVPEKWQREYASTERRDRPYVKRKDRASAVPLDTTDAPAEADEATAVAADPCPDPPCPELDDVPSDPACSLADLIAAINVPSTPDANAAAEAVWSSALDNSSADAEES